ncbi:MAG: MYXO-CTERM sorting domain-containing protein, partial [Polyangiaceae bacterium]
IDMYGTSLDVSDLTIKNGVFGLLTEGGQITVDGAIMTGNINPGNSDSAGFSTLGGAAPETTLTVTNALVSGFNYGGQFDGAGITPNLSNVTFVGGDDGGCATSGSSSDPGSLSLVGFVVALFSVTRRRKERR